MGKIDPGVVKTIEYEAILNYKVNLKRTIRSPYYNNFHVGYADGHSLSLFVANVKIEMSSGHPPYSCFARNDFLNINIAQNTVFIPVNQVVWTPIPVYLIWPISRTKWDYFGIKSAGEVLEIDHFAVAEEAYDIFERMLWFSKIKYDFILLHFWFLMNNL